MPKRRTLAQQIAALKPGRQTIEAEREELRWIEGLDHRGRGPQARGCLADSRPTSKWRTAR